MKTIDFNLLNTGHFVIADLGALRQLDYGWRDLVQEKPEAATSQQWEMIVDRIASIHGSALDLLARSVAFDQVVFDQEALTRVHSANPFRSRTLLNAQWLAATPVPLQVYDSACDVIISFTGRQNSHNWMSNKFFDPELKTLHDEWFDDPDFKLRVHLADSSDTIARLLFYLEVSRATRLPMLMGPAKRGLFKYIRPRIQRDALQLVSEHVNKLLRTQFEDLDVIDVRVPPLVDFICSHAKRHRTSLVVAADTVRSSDNAREFRKWLHGLQRLIVPPMTNEKQAKLASTLSRLQDAVEEWVNHGDFRLGVTHKRKVAKLEHLPAIGWPAKIFEALKFSFDDPILRPRPSYLAFISDWFAPPK
ncbi:MAG: hypothetical protein QM770_17680 [Tepidisphaeraceae bacterium]